jgi:hypothetical protein
MDPVNPMESAIQTVRLLGKAFLFSILKALVHGRFSWRSPLSSSSSG